MKVYLSREKNIFKSLTYFTIFLYFPTPHKTLGEGRHVISTQPQYKTVMIKI